MAIVVVVFLFPNKIAERFPEVKLKEIQKLKENPETKNTNITILQTILIYHLRYLCQIPLGTLLLHVQS